MKGVLLTVLLSAIACSSSASTAHLESGTVNFSEVQWYADRASAAYQTKNKIQAKFPQVQHFGTIAETDLQYFVENLKDSATQLIAIRGTASIRNAIEDFEYLQSKNKKLNIYVHSGFDENAYLIYKQLLPHLDQSKQILLTGHSLGAAISTLLMMYLHEDGYNLGLSINFGQPKVTNQQGSKKYQHLPLLRIVDENDVVPTLPANTLADTVHGVYAHFGSSVILLEGQYYVFQDRHLQTETEANSLWDNAFDVSIKAHFIQHYLHNIQSKLTISKPIPYDERKQYIDN